MSENGRPLSDGNPDTKPGQRASSRPAENGRRQEQDPPEGVCSAWSASSTALLPADFPGDGTPEIPHPGSVYERPITGTKRAKMIAIVCVTLSLRQSVELWECT